MQLTETERLKRWRMVLGGGSADGTNCTLEGSEINMDKALEQLYDAGNSSGRKGGLGQSAPNVARWLGDIRGYFPSSVVRVMQKDALERLGLHQMLLEKEMLENLEPDLNLAVNLITLRGVMPEKIKDTARMVVRKVVDDLLKRLAQPTRQAVSGALNRAQRNNRPRHNEIDWNRTLKANLKNYQLERKIIIPQIRIGYGRKRSSLRDIVLCIDQSGSMANSIVYSSIFGAVLASLPAVSTKLIVFDTQIVDLTEDLQDPVDVLFGINLGGGTDINRALAYCESQITRPTETILILISDLYEGGDNRKMLARAASMLSSGVQMIGLLALSDEGAPFYDHEAAALLAGLGAPTFACTPDLFPELMAAAINRADITQWAASRDIVTSRPQS
jgi:hypothetical protein